MKFSPQPKHFIIFINIYLMLILYYINTSFIVRLLLRFYLFSFIFGSDSKSTKIFIQLLQLKKESVKSCLAIEPVTQQSPRQRGNLNTNCKINFVCIWVLRMNKSIVYPEIPATNDWIDNYVRQIVDVHSNFHLVLLSVQISTRCICVSV